MPLTVFLICFPFLVSPLMYIIKNSRIRRYVSYISSALILIASLALAGWWISNGCRLMAFFPETGLIDKLILAGEVILMFVIVFYCFKYKRYWISLLSIIPTGLMVWLELFSGMHFKQTHIYLDHLSVLMCLIIGIVGVLIVLYAVGYMHGYHQHHSEIKDRRNYFFMVLYLFLGAMYGFVLSSSLIWIDLFWEITSVCSFLLISYTQTDEAIQNAFRALWMNLLGGVALAFGIVYFAVHSGSTSFFDLVAQGSINLPSTVIPIALIAFAALTKTAQMPFSSWLMGAMVAPTPSSALLHSATMVKAGIYVLLRLSPTMDGTLTGLMIAFIGGFTFFTASILAMTESDGKKVLAFSTISNLGLMVGCAGVGRPETVWAAVFLLIFHAVSKSLLFQDVGATENATGSRDIEDMHGLLFRMPKLAAFMFIGIAGMFLAPFGMLVSKWSALKAAVDSNNILFVLFIAFGSATTSFYWSKWLGKLISHSHRTNAIEVDHTTKMEETISMTVHTVLMILLCMLMPFISKSYVDPMLVELFGTFTDVLSMPIMITLVVVILVVFAVPIISYLYSKNVKTNTKMTYMSGINVGDNKKFIDSYGNERKLWLANYYFHDIIHPNGLIIFSQVTAAAALIILLCFIVGGAL
ncbi:MAG: NADH-quinone oxidoreductase subunit L [Eubacteriaceae bacterium]|nr:NADH-quinone oxidoreductase subunit L [Eubacteriaceae bacterium]